MKKKPGTVGCRPLVISGKAGFCQNRAAETNASSIASLRGPSWRSRSVRRHRGERLASSAHGMPSVSQDRGISIIGLPPCGSRRRRHLAKASHRQRNPEATSEPSVRPVTTSMSGRRPDQGQRPFPRGGAISHCAPPPDPDTKPRHIVGAAIGLPAIEERRHAVAFTGIGGAVLVARDRGQLSFKGWSPRLIACAAPCAIRNGCRWAAVCARRNQRLCPKAGRTLCPLPDAMNDCDGPADRTAAHSVRSRASAMPACLGHVWAPARRCGE